MTEHEHDIKHEIIESRHAAVVTLPLPPIAGSARARVHWRTKLKAKHEYWMRCYAWEAFASLRSIPAELRDVTPPFILDRPPFVGSDLSRYVVDVGVHIYTFHLMDRDNAMARLKWAIDWMIPPRKTLRGVQVLAVPRKFGDYAASDAEDVFRLEMPRQTRCRPATAQRVAFTLHYVSRR